MYICDRWNHTVRKVFVATSISVTVSGIGKQKGFVDGKKGIAKFKQPFCIVVDKNDLLYVSDLGNHAIRTVTQDGNVKTLCGKGIPGHQDGTFDEVFLNEPAGLAIDRRGENLFVADFSNNCIRQLKISASQASTICGVAGKSGWEDGMPGVALFHSPCAITLDISEKSLFVADLNNHCIRKVIISSGLTSTFCGSGSSGYRDGVGKFKSFAALSFSRSKPFESIVSVLISSIRSLFLFLPLFFFASLTTLRVL